MALISFGSDNHAGVHPRLFAALEQANRAYAPSYGMDDETLALQKQARDLLGCEDSFLVFNGTAANVLSLATMVQSFESVACTDIAHLNEDECAAPEKFLGAKLVALPHMEGKLSLDRLQSILIRRGDQHSSQLKAISITQPTEYGTVYSLAEMRAFREFCDTHKLYLHIDGARLGNAAVTLGCELRDLIAFSDVTSFGGTKNGLLCGELVVIGNPELAKNFKFRRKQAMQLPSKTRFLAAQFSTYFENGLWREIASHQCAMARYLGERLRALGLRENFPIQSNAVFCNLPKPVVKALRDEFFFYVWNEATFECRLMTSYATTKEEIDAFVTKLGSLL